MWLGVGLRTNIKKKKSVTSKEIRLHAQNRLTILDSIVDIFVEGGSLYDHLMGTRIFTLIMNKIFIRALKFAVQNVTSRVWIC